MTSASLRNIMKNYKAQKAYFIIVVAVLALTPSCGWWKTKQEQAVVTDTTAPTQEHTTRDLKLIYITDEEQFQDAHIPGSVYMDIKDMQEKTKQWPKDTAIVTYCASYLCHSSKEAVDKLKSLGFTNVKAYKAGIAEWYQKSQTDSQRYPVAGKATAPWLKQELEKPQDLDAALTISSQELSDQIKLKKGEK